MFNGRDKLQSTTRKKEFGLEYLSYYQYYYLHSIYLDGILLRFPLELQTVHFGLFYVGIY